VCTLAVFFLTSVVPPPSPYAQLDLPASGERVALSAAYQLPLLSGIRVDPADPLKLEFVIDPGDSDMGEQAFKEESGRLVRYFLASMTLPEDDLWVNLSPYEKERIIPEAFSQTEMGRDVLAQDYLLKQITAALIYPEDKWGKAFWDKVYALAFEKYGTTDVPIDTFNKVWVIPEKAVVYEKSNRAKEQQGNSETGQTAALLPSGSEALDTGVA